MSKFIIEPKFNRLNNALYFNVGSLNTFQRAEYGDNFGFLQSQFGVYSHMTMNSDQEYVIHYPKGTPLLWQTHNSCAWTPTGTLSMGTKSITPCKAKINEQNCYDEWFNSAYKAWLQWNPNQPLSMTPAGVTATNELTRTLVKNATLGARLTLSAGQLHDLTAVAFQAGTPSRIEDAFRSTASTCKGWIQLVRSMAGTYPHLETSDVAAGDISSDGETYTASAIGSVVNLYDALLAGAPKPLKNAVISGGVNGYGDSSMPLMIVSPSIGHAVYYDWIAQKESATINQPRIERREYQVSTDRGARTQFVYFIDNTAIIPLDEINYLDEYVTGTSHFAYLTMSGVIQLGSSFSALPALDTAEVGIMMQMSTNAKDYGTHDFLAHALLATAINDTDFITGSYAYATPA